jgi:diacylglycerol kinase family enzyme
MILNRDAGSLLALDSAAYQTLQDDLADIAERHGWQLEVASVSADGVAHAIEHACGARADALFIGGGDGTIKGAVAQMAGSDLPLGILPLGTMNLLAHDLDLPIDARQAFQAQIGGRSRAIDVASINGETFVNAVRLGFVTRMTAAREWARVKGRRGLGKWWAMLRAGWTVLRTRRRLHVSLSPAGASPVDLHCYGLMVTNNRYDPSITALVKRAEVDGGYLTVYAPTHRSPWGIVKLIASLPFGIAEADERLAIFETDSLTVRTRNRKLQASIDGELTLVDTPLAFKIRPRALTVLMPRQAPDADAGARDDETDRPP